MPLSKKTEPKEKPKTEKPKPKNVQNLKRRLESSYEKGYDMIKKMGFEVGSGLGKDGQGMLNPIEHQKKTELSGGSDPLLDLGLYSEYTDEVISDLIE
jgi:hypothetical protein